MSSVASSTSSTATTVISSQGIGSGLDIASIVSSLTDAKAGPETNALNRSKTALTAQVSAFGTFNSALATFQATLATLKDPTQLAGRTATVGDSTIATATATAAAVPGQYTLQVQNLAAAASLSSQPFASADSTVGTGTLTIKVGALTASLTLDSTNNTLAGIAAAINSGTGNPAVPPSGLTQTQAAVDANFSINGYPATSSGNQVSTAITGVTFNLLKATAAGTPTTPAASTTLTVGNDTAGAQTSIGTFVTALNGLLTSIQSLTSYDPATQTAGPLLGNATLQSFQNQLSKILGQVNAGISNGPNSLAAIG